MKLRALLIVGAITLMVNLMAQRPSMVLSLTAVDHSSNYCRLDSIKIVNRTQEADTVLYWPDTTLVLNYQVGITEINPETDALTILQNFPNPVSDKTTITAFIPQTDKVVLNVSDLFGRMVIQSEMALERGYHTFVFTPGSEDVYFLSMSSGGTTRSIKILCSLASYEGKTNLDYTGIITNQNLFKSVLKSRGFKFNLNDELLFIGYSGTIKSHVSDIPTENKLYVLPFAFSNPCPYEPTVVYEGQIYNTIQIGDQCWFKENLNVGIELPGSENQSDNGIFEKYCYENDPVNCTIYGGLYQWDEMMQYADGKSNQGLCPTGWHVASDVDWMTLEGFVDSQFDYPDPEWNDTGWRGFDAGLNLKSSIDWYSVGTGADLYGFSVLPGGNLIMENGYESMQFSGDFWTSGDYDNTHAWKRSLNYGNDWVGRDNSHKSNGLNVRCVKDGAVPQWNCGDELIDNRDGQTYNTVLIGQQCWMAENLNIGNKINGVNNPANNGIIEKYCYDDLEGNCDEFGGLYQWDEMMDYTTTESTQGICPDGWHLATDYEWFLMTNYLDPTINNPVFTGWQGFDIGDKLIEGGTSGFEALFAGKRNWDSGEFQDQSESGYFWTSTNDTSSSTNVWFRQLSAGNSKINKNGFIKTGGFAVRCLKGLPAPPWSCGDTLLDNRDGKTYKTILINQQCWMAENLNVGSRIDGNVNAVNNQTIEKYCYNNIEDNCDEFGGLYQWDEMMDYSTIEGTQGICPAGWHIATDVEWFQMTNFLDPTVSNPDFQGWQGTDIGNQLLEGGISGFEALFSGRRLWDLGGFSDLDEKSFFWTSTFDESNTNFSMFRQMDEGNTQMNRNSYVKTGGFAIRCVRSFYNPVWSCGDPMIDTRDGQTYNTVPIGEQCWMAENLNIGTRINGTLNQMNNEVIEKYCYDNYEENCDQFGALYQWDEMMEYTTLEGVKGICPEGWHLATDLEWFQMANFLDPTVTIPEYQGWQGTDIGIQLLGGGTSGFEALLTGRRIDGGVFQYHNERSYFWTSTINPYNFDHGWFRQLNDGNLQIYRNGGSRTTGFAVRCIKNIQIPNWGCGDPLVDPRDEQSYNTVQIGEQCWMAENMNIGTKVNGGVTQTDNELIEKYCYDNVEENCDEYGAFYQWDELMQYTTLEGAQGICPEGWHLATDLEWFQMTNFLDPSVTNPDLQSWQGTDIGTQLIQGGSSGFEAEFSGYRHASSALFLSLGEVSSFWTSTFDPYNTSNAWFRKLENGNPLIYKNGYNKAGGVAVRCLMNY